MSDDKTTAFCDFEVQSLGSICKRCGTWVRQGTPTCPPWITRDEPDNARLPHITTSEQNKAAMDAWTEVQWARERAAMKEHGYV